MPRLGSCRTISTNGSEVTTRSGRIKAAGVSASRRCKHSLTPSPLRGKKRSLPDHHQQRTGHLQKGTVCKIKYKLLHLGLVPRRYQSGEIDYTGSISKCGDGRLRTLLYEAANVMLTRYRGSLALKNWALDIARRSTLRKARVALARRLAARGQEPFLY